MSLAVKICGIMTPEHGRAAVLAGADYIGLIFAPSRRLVTTEQARTIVAAARAAATEREAAVQIVGVFVNEQPQMINQLATELGLDWVQLSGHEPVAQADTIERPVVKAIRFDKHASEDEWLHGAPRYPLLVDAHVAGSYGGAGVTGDWLRAAELALHRSIWLAGGLRPDTVAQAIEMVRPQLVDVSSGVETAGVKDIAKIQAFISAAKQAGARLTAVPRADAHAPTTA